MSIDIQVAVDISISTGWLKLEDEINGYEMGANSFSDRTITAKQRTVGDDRVDIRGSLVIASAPGNVTETLEVYVTGTDPYDFDVKMQRLVDAFSQPKYQVRRTIGGAVKSVQTWDCFPCETISFQTTQPFFVATTGLFHAEVPRLPDIDLQRITAP